LVGQQERHPAYKNYRYWWQYAVSKSGTLLLSQEGSSLEAGGQGDATITVFLIYLDSMMAISCP